MFGVGNRDGTAVGEDIGLVVGCALGALVGTAVGSLEGAVDNGVVVKATSLVVNCTSVLQVKHRSSAQLGLMLSV